MYGVYCTVLAKLLPNQAHSEIAYWRKRQWPPFGDFCHLLDLSDILTGVTTTIVFFWDVTLCSLVEIVSTDVQLISKFANQVSFRVGSAELFLA
jgi:hypothetical protein